MSDYLRAQLSAFIDGELPRHEIELLFKRLDGNAELRATLARYTVIGESLRTRASEGPSRSFAERVRAAVQANGPLAAGMAITAARIQWRWLKPVAGLAVAATVAAVALIGLQRMQNPALDESAQIAASSAPPTVVIGEPSPAESPSYIVPAPASPGSLVNAARLTNYVVAHSEYSSPLGRRNVLSGIVAETPASLDARDENENDPRAAAPTDLTVEQQ